MCETEKCPACKEEKCPVFGAESDEDAVEVVAKAYQANDPNVHPLRWCLHYRLHERHGKRLRRFASRFPLIGRADEDENVVREEISQFTSSEAIAKFQTSQNKSVAAYLTGMVRHACLNIIRDHIHLIPFGDWAPPRPPEDAGQTTTFKELCGLYQAILQLPPEQRVVMLIDLGWHPLFNASLGRVPQRGDGKQIAEFLGIAIGTLARRRRKAKEQLAAWSVEIEGRRGRSPEWIRQAFDTLVEERALPAWDVRPWHFEMPFARFAIRLVIEAEELGIAGIADLLRTAGECDLLGDYEDALSLVTQIERGADARADLGAEAHATLWTNAAMYLEHTSAEKERKGEYQDAMRLLEEGKRLLRGVVPTDTEHIQQRTATYREKQWRAVYHLGILTRREMEIRRLSEPDNTEEHQELLAAARAFFREVLVFSNRQDTRISATHQLAICDLLSGKLDDAEAGFRLCLRAWEHWEQIEKGGMERPEEVHMRMAYEYRRLGHVFATRAKTMTDSHAQQEEYRRALDEFHTAMFISIKTCFMRYVVQIAEDMRRLMPPDLISGNFGL